MLTIDATRLQSEDCEGFCFANPRLDEIIVHAPRLNKAADTQGNARYDIMSGTEICEQDDHEY